ncbi:MAG: 4-(cytidine 5'-diphospho)-2-C-methyl-D-erythritol kinase, partial [Alphaproteobacteria bacterium TMED150]
AEVNPHIADMIAKIGMVPGCIRAGLSGSGGTCFGLFECHEEEMMAQAVLRLRTSNYWAVAGPIQL